jgi:hypothetical protein
MEVRKRIFVNPERFLSILILSIDHLIISIHSFS